MIIKIIYSLGVLGVIISFILISIKYFITDKIELGIGMVSLTMILIATTISFLKGE